MALAFAHFFGFYNPKQLAEFHIPHQKLYAQLKDCSLYYIKEILVRFMVKQAVEHLKPALSKSAATQSIFGHDITPLTIVSLIELQLAMHGHGAGIAVDIMM